MEGLYSLQEIAANEERKKLWERTAKDLSGMSREEKSRELEAGKRKQPTTLLGRINAKRAEKNLPPLQ